MTPYRNDAFDAATAADLCGLLGSAGVERLMAAFTRELRERPGRIAELIRAGRIDEARFEAHYLKGAAMSIGAAAVVRAAEAVEHGAEAALGELAATLRCRAGEALAD